MPIAALFPGQGSQSLGMLAELNQSYPIIQQTFEQASDVIQQDLWIMAQEGPAEVINLTANTQPLMLSAGVAVWRVWLEQGGAEPIAFAGHSLGEYSALVAGEAIAFEDAIPLVRQRAELMQAAVPAEKAGMAAVLGLDDQVVIDALGTISAGIVEAVNFNAPGQVVIAGEIEAVKAAEEPLSEAGAKKIIPLAVSVPSHCSLMQSASEHLAQSLADCQWQQATQPILHNVDAKPSEQASEIPQKLGSQLHQPVQWVKTINHMITEQGAEGLLEFGPGKVLTGLNKRINRRLPSSCIHDTASLEQALEQFA